jgi:hypothetical protein
MQIDIPLTGPQKEFCQTVEPYPAIIGGLGSGKSRGGTMRAIIKLLECSGSNIGYYMPSYDLLNLRAMPGVEDDLNMLGMSFSVNKSKYTIDVQGYGRIIFRSYDRPERIVAYETAHSIVDELDTLKKEKAALVWRKISERNRQAFKALDGSKGINTIACVTTPDQGYSGFIYEKWYKKKQSGYQVIKAPTYSNPYLPDGYIEQIRANYDALLAEMYIEGEIVSLNDKKVYHFFNRGKHHTCETINESEQLHIGLDFNIGGCCATTWAIRANVPYCLDEFVSHDTHDFCNNLTRYKGHKVTVYPDASGGSGSTNASASDLDIIRQAGFAVSSPNKNPFVRDRINVMNNKISKGDFYVNTDLCPELTNALEVQGYDKNNEPEKFKEHPAIDDWNDCAGYFMHKRFGIKTIASAPAFARR